MPMNRIACFICVLLVTFSLLPEASLGQVPREVPGQDALRAIPPQNRMRIPDPLIRNQLQDRVRSGEYVPLSEIRKKIRELYPDSKIVDVRLLRARREGLNDLFDVRVLTDAGKVLSVRFDAKSAEIVDVKE